MFNLGSYWRAIVAAKRRFKAPALWRALSICCLPFLFPKKLSTKFFLGALYINLIMGHFTCPRLFWNGDRVRRTPAVHARRQRRRRFAEAPAGKRQNPFLCAIVAAKRRFKAPALWRALSICCLPFLFPKKLSTKFFLGALYINLIMGHFTCPRLFWNGDRVRRTPAVHARRQRRRRFAEAPAGKRQNPFLCAIVAAKRRFKAPAIRRALSICYLPFLTLFTPKCQTDF